jgi:hypothetical protein
VAAEVLWDAASSHADHTITGGGRTAVFPCANNFKASRAALPMSSGVFVWEFKGALTGDWEDAKAGICSGGRGSEGAFLGENDNARVFTGYTTAYGRDLRPLTDASVLRLTLDCDARTLAVSVDGVPRPGATFTNLPAGQTWFVAAGGNESDSCVTLLKGPSPAAAAVGGQASPSAAPGALHKLNATSSWPLWDAASSHADTTKTDGGRTAAFRYNNYKASRVALPISSGVFVWEVKGENWFRTAAGICTGGIGSEGGWLGQNDNARVFTGQDPLGNNSRDLRPLSDASVLRLTLDCHARTLSVSVDGVPRPGATFTDLPAGRTWFVAAGNNNSASRVTLIEGPRPVVASAVGVGVVAAVAAGSSGTASLPVTHFQCA